MKTLVGLLCVALAPVAAQAAAPAGSSAVLTPIHQFIDNFNKGDAKTAAATHADDATIQDEVPPHVWRGPGAFQAWAADLDKASKAAGQTDESVTLGKPVRADVNGDVAYVVIPAQFKYRQHGKRMVEPAQMVFSLRQEASAWKIAAWAWTGGTPHAVVPKPAAPAATAAAPTAPIPAPMLSH